MSQFAVSIKIDGRVAAGELSRNLFGNARSSKLRHLNVPTDTAKIIKSQSSE